MLAAVWTTAAPPEPPGSVREVVYFGPAPVRFRLHIAIGGRPVEAVWEDAVGALFNFLDRNGDGVLDATERAAVTQPARTRDPVVAVPPDGNALPLRLTFERKDEKVTREVFATVLRGSGYEPVRLTSVAGRPDSAQLSAALFRYLDRDKDGKLSADELRAARELLAPLDANEDEWLTPPEVLGRASTPNPNPVAVAGMQMAEDAASAFPDLLFLAADGTPAVKQILAARGGTRATSLRRSEFGADAAAFAALDKDGNGRLDTAELSAWLRQPPDADLALGFGPGRPTLLPAEGGRPGAFRVEAGGAVAGTTPGTRWHFDPLASSRTAWEAAAERLQKQFRELAKAKGSVSRKQVDKDPIAPTLFDFADHNADGKVDLAEVEAALKVLAPLATCRVEITFTDGGNGLFELLDSNGDGRLSPRELIQAATVLRPYADAGGRVGPRDLPRRFTVRATAGGIPLVVPPLAGPAMAQQGSAAPARAESVPAWFTKMDRNGDGDVSLREFLGPLELFRKLDRDGDGLISPAEARAAGR
jgi:Ca2+-binding EF-hand superfamily protein